MAYVEDNVNCLAFLKLSVVIVWNGFLSLMFRSFSLNNVTITPGMQAAYNWPFAIVVCHILCEIFISCLFVCLIFLQLQFLSEFMKLGWIC